jgi:Ca2+ transporting ATPase
MAENAYSREWSDICEEFKVNPDVGLNAAQVSASLAQYGSNELPHKPPTSLWKLVLEQFEDLLVQILLGAAVVSFLLAFLEEGDDWMHAFVEPLVILLILIANAIVGVVQESNAESAIEKLKQSEAKMATVLREGKYVTIASAGLVPGDIITVAQGDKVPADARLIKLHSAALSVEEAMLTGESVPPQKHCDRVNKSPHEVVNQDKRNTLFSGTLVVRGKATAVVVLTGSKTEMGKIANDLSEDDESKTPLQEKLDEFAEQLSKVILVICISVWVINIGHFTEVGGWVKGGIYYFKIAVALAVAAIPEGLPAVVTTCLALGTRKMAQKNAIVRTLPSVETLGCTTVICSDKTGTLTTNQMSVLKVVVPSGPNEAAIYDVSGDSFSPHGIVTLDEKEIPFPAQSNDSLAEVSRISVLCNEAKLEYNEKSSVRFGKIGAPTEAAMLVLAEKLGTNDKTTNAKTQSLKDAQRVDAAARFYRAQVQNKTTLEFDRHRKSMSVLIGGELLCKGAPESVLQRCNYVKINGKVSALNSSQFKGDGSGSLESELTALASQGLRVLALATKKNVKESAADLGNLDKYDVIESDMTFIGFVAMLDPPRKEVRPCIEKCRTAGIQVIVITGDNRVTAEAICRRIGVFGDNEDLTGKSYTGGEFEQLSAAQKQEAVKTASLFSRVEPRHKQELVQLLQGQGQVVAMTGDGVNDATALKKADIGIAMGTGTDVAREASDMVLQDDNFATIVMAIEEGRAIYANTKQFIRYLISSNIGEVACIFLTAALGLPEALIPVQLLWVNLVTDGPPATALGFNPPDIDIMQQAPRGRKDKIIDGWMFTRYMIIGLYVGFATVAGFVWWFLFAARGPAVTWEQLTNFHSCGTAAGAALYGDIDCAVFHSAIPSTISLSILVLIEMLNAFNALSENQSLLVVTIFSNIYVVIACAFSMLLHMVILYVPFLRKTFHTEILNAEEWWIVFVISAAVIPMDEVLKFFTRMQGYGGKKNL